MSLYSEYMSLRKKRLKDESEEIKSTAKKTTNNQKSISSGSVKTTTKANAGSSLLSEYLNLREERLYENDFDIAPVSERVSSRLTTDIAPIKKEEKKWYQKGLFEDGYDFGVITKSILGIDPKSENESLIKTYTDPTPEISLDELKSKMDGSKKQVGNLEDTQRYNQKYLAQTSQILAQTKMDGTKHSILEEMEAIAKMDSGKEKRQRKKAVLAKMEELGIDTADYALFIDDKNFTVENFTKWLGNAFMLGLNNFNMSLTNTAEKILGDPLEKLGWENNPITKLDDYYTSTYESYKYNTDLYKEKLGGGGGMQFASDAVEGTTAALPNALLAIMTAGKSLEGTATGLIQNAAYQGANILQKAGIKGLNMIKDSQFWLSFGRSYGNDYDEAIAKGVDDKTAAFGATITSLLNAGVEIGLDGGSGIQGLPKDIAEGGKDKILSWVTSSLEEGGEEGVQKFISEIVGKLVYKDDDEILNPIEYGKDMTLGTISGALLGGGQITAQSVVNNAIQKHNGSIATETVPKVADSPLEEGTANPSLVEKENIVQKDVTTPINAHTSSGFTGSYTGTKYNATQAELLSSVSLEGIQNATDLFSRRDVTFNDIGINDKQVQQQWVEEGLATVEKTADGADIVVVNDAMLMDERERRQHESKNQNPLPEYTASETTFANPDDVTQPSSPIAEESTAPKAPTPELQELYEKRQSLQDTIMARYNEGLYNEETENMARQWTAVNDKIAEIEAAQNQAVTSTQETVQADTEQIEPTTTEKVQKRLRDKVLDFEKLFDADTPENVARFESVSRATEIAQDFISKGAEGVKSIPQIFNRISEKGDLDDFESYLRHRLNEDRSSIEQRYGTSNKPVFGDFTAEQSRQIADELEQAHPEFKQAAEDVYAFNNYLLDLRVKAGRVTQEWANRWREMYPHFVPISRSRHGDTQAYTTLLNFLQGQPLDTSDSSAVDSFLGDVDSAAEVHKITSSGHDFNPLIDTMVNQAFTVYWDLASNQPGSLVAPTYTDITSDGIESAPLLNDSTTENEQTQPDVDTVTIETEPSADSPSLFEYDPNKLMDSKTGVGKVIQDVTNAVEVYILDDAIPFEKVAKKTGTSLDASWHATRNSFSSAQHFIGNGNEAHGVRALTDIVKEVNETDAKEDFLAYLGHLRNIDGMSLHYRFGLANNQNFMGKDETYAKSNKAVREFEESHPEFKQLAEDIYAYTDYLRNQFVERGMISQEDADMWKELYPHFVPMRFTGKGSVDSMLETLAHFTTESFNTLAMNEFGVDLKNALQTEIGREPANILSFINRLDSGDSLFLFGENGDRHTFTVYENGERVTFDITDEMYMALSDAHKWMDSKIPVLYQVNEAFRKFCTEWNIFFSLKNGVKDPQDIIYNSKHPVETYARLVDAGTAIACKELGQQSKYSHYYEEYLANGGEPITFFDSSKGKFTSWTDPSELIQYVTGLKAVGAVNDRVEKLPRLAEYIASRVAGRSVKEAMLDSAQVTTNFAAGGKFTKFLNRNGCTFLNASVQGALQHVRNFANAATDADGKLHFDTKEAKVAAVKSVASLIARGLAVGMATIAINDLRWKDDEEYEQLPVYVKDGYYLLFKFGDGQFFRIPKGRTNTTVEEGIRQVAKESFGNDEADWDNFWQIFFENIAPNNPLTNNIFAPIREVFKGETWYGEELIPRRLQDEETVDQYDEKTDRISVALSKKLEESSFDEWLNETVDGTAIEKWFSESGFGDGLSPKEINYLINSYTGVLGDLVLPHFTPKAETSSDNPLVQALAPLKDIFTTDSVLNNKLTGEFYDTLESVEAKAESKDATPEDKLKSGILIGYNVEISDLMKEQREIQNSDKPDSEKYKRTRELKKEINALQEEALGLLDDYEIDGNYAESGDKRYNYDSKDDTWWEVKPELANGKPNPYYVQEQLSHDNLGLSYADFWNGRKPSPDFEGKTYYAEYNGKRYNYDVEDNSWYEIKPKKKNGDDNYYYQQEQIAHNKLGISYEDFWNNREAYMDAIYVAKNGVEYGWGTPYYETAKTAIGLDTFTQLASGMANIKGESRYDDMNNYIYSLDIPDVQKHILFKAEYPKTNKHNYEIIDYLNEREDISYEEMETILKELGFEVDSKGNITW